MIAARALPTPWWARPDQLSATYRWLVDKGHLDTSDPDAVQRFLRAPWEREDAFAEMQREAHVHVRHGN